MWKNTLLVALRSLRRRKGYAALNVAGLALGFACVLVIGLYVFDEWRYDRFHANAGRIVRLGADLVSEGDVNVHAETPGLLAPALEADVPAVEHAVRLIEANPVLRVGARTFEETPVFYADPAFFAVFDGFRLVRGSAATALAAPGNLVLTERLARRLFGDADPIGRPVMDGDRTLTVTGVVADPPPQSHLAFDGLVSLATADDPGWYYQNWLSVNFLTYALLREGASVEAFRAGLPAFVERRAGAELREAEQNVVLEVERLTDLHLRSARGGTAGGARRLAVLGAVALFVLVLAGVNFTNLATARSAERAREVGVRKALGAGRGALAAGFLAEAVVLSGLALALAFGLVALALPAFALLAGKSLALGSFGPWLGAWVAAAVALAVFVGMGAGAYPALVLSRFQPADVLRGRFAGGRRGVTLRRALVVVQFGVAVGLIAATGVVFTQLRFMQERDLGFDAGSETTGRLVTVRLGAGDAVPARLASVKARFAAHPSVLGVTSSLAVPVGGHPQAGGEIERPEGGLRDFSVESYLVDTAFVRVYGMTLVAGRAPGAETTSDSLAGYVLNETAVREAGYAGPEAVLGRRVSFWGRAGEVVGVVRDFHTRGLQQPVAPLALAATDEYQSVLTLRIRASDVPGTMRALGAIWDDAAPERPFEPSFLDDAFGAQYEAERRFGRVFGVFALLAVVIGCLGLFGLAAFTAGQRAREIGVRRVLGASVAGIVALLSKDFVRLVLAGVVLATPLAYGAMRAWLDGFAYRAPLGPAPFVLAGLGALLVALVTVGAQAVRAATADPVRALRSE